MRDASTWFWFALAGTFIVALAVAWSRWPVAPRSSDADRELTLLLDRAAVEDLRDQLRVGPVPVRAWSETTLLRGPALIIDLGTQRLRVRLYGEACLPEGSIERAGRLSVGDPLPLVRIDDLGVRGWLIRLDAPDGPRRYHGWQVETVAAPRGTPLAAIA